MNVLLIGSGGREHTLAWKMKQSRLVQQLFIAPGNGGTEGLGENIAINVSDFNAVRSLVLDKQIGMVVVGPEAPLVDGIGDFFQKDRSLHNVQLIGPCKAGAMLEGSKDFAKAFMQKYNIPTARYRSFTASQREEAFSFLDTMKKPYVLKADGLAAGKGVLILDDLDQAKQELVSMFSGKFGKAGNTVVVEEFLAGIEVSYFIYTDGKDYVMFPEAKDYKKIGEGDTGLNTGGMGSISPVPFCDKVFTQKVISRIIEPTLTGLQKEGIGYHGFMFFGLMKVNGEPNVIEYNVRLGDPETEAILPRIDSDIVEMFAEADKGDLSNYDLKVTDQFAASVMLVSGGYPGKYEKGKAISNHDNISGSLVLHAGTKRVDGEIVTNGGRVMAVTSIKPSMNEAIKQSMKVAELIDFEEKYYRKDIGFDLQ